MTKRIFRGLCCVALAVFLASLVFIMAVLYGYFSRVQQTQLGMQTQLAAQGVARCGADYFDGLDARDYRVTWVDADGGVLYDSGADASSMEGHLDRPEIRQALADGHGESRRLSATLTERMLYAAQRLPDGTVLRLAIAQSSIFAMLLGAGQGLAAVLLLALALSVFLARRLSRRIVQPLDQIDLDAPLESEAYPELTPLLHRLDAQQRQLHAQNAQLELDMAERAEAEAMRRQFTANVSHELKTPLHVISGYAELIENGMVQPEDVRPFAGRIRDEAQLMVKLVEDVIRLSHLDEGARDMQFERTDLAAAARQAAESLADEAEKAGVSVSFSGEPLYVEGIPSLLHSIVFDLCENGIKYNHRGGSVTVSVKPEDGAAVLTVSDDGVGIPPEQQEHVFERFYRGDSSRCKSIPGTGLGLSIVKHAALVHGAQIALTSTPGQGTTVTVRFPCLGQAHT